MKIIIDIAVSENGLVFNPISGDSFKVNDIGMEIIKLIRLNIEAAEIKDIIFQKYEVERNVIEIDYNDFANCLIRNQLIQEEPEKFSFND